MALPTLVKDYQVIANNTIAADATIDANTESHRDRRNLLLAIKNQMIATSQVSDVGPTPGGAINNWTVVRSSDGTSVANSDLWVTNLNLQFDSTGQTHSWIVLEQTGIATNFQVCIDLVQTTASNDGGNFGVIVSPGGFDLTTGSTTARPTPTTTDPLDEVVILSTGNWGSGANGGGAKAFVWHMWITEDGEVTHIVIHHADNALGFWTFSKPQSPSSGWDGTQFVAVVKSENSDTAVAPTYVNFYDAASLFTFRSNRISTANAFNQTTLYFTADTFGSGPLGQELTVANDITGEYVFGDIGLLSTNSNFVGRHGSMFDLYWGQAVLGVPADNYPSGGSKIWVQFGALIFPWDGATPVTT